MIIKRKLVAVTYDASAERLVVRYSDETGNIQELEMSGTIASIAANIDNQLATAGPLLLSAAIQAYLGVDPTLTGAADLAASPIGFSLDPITKAINTVS